MTHSFLRRFKSLRGRILFVFLILFTTGNGIAYLIITDALAVSRDLISDTRFSRVSQAVALRLNDKAQFIWRMQKRIWDDNKADSFTQKQFDKLIADSKAIIGAKDVVIMWPDGRYLAGQLPSGITTTANENIKYGAPGMSVAEILHQSTESYLLVWTSIDTPKGNAFMGSAFQLTDQFLRDHSDTHGIQIILMSKHFNSWVPMVSSIGIKGLDIGQKMEEMYGDEPMGEVLAVDEKRLKIMHLEFPSKQPTKLMLYTSADYLTAGTTYLLPIIGMVLLMNVVLSLVIGNMFSKQALSPLKKLAEGAQRFVNGDLEVKINEDAPTSDLQIVVNSFNQMVDSIRHDEKTGLYNLNYFVSRLKEEIYRSSRVNISFGLLMFDLDRFKQLNDTYGHQAGDKALVEVANTLRSSCRKHDIPARFGGEEMIMLIRDVDEESLFKVAEKIREKIAQVTIVYEGEVIHVTTSIGAVVCTNDKATPHDLINIADKALYEAKSAGRNRTVMLPAHLPISGSA